MGVTDTPNEDSSGPVRGVGDYIALLTLAAAGAAAVVWAIAVFPTFSSEIAVASVAKAVAAGEAFKPNVLASIDAETENSARWKLRSSMLGKAAVIRLRLAEDAIQSGDVARIDRSLESLTKIIDASLMNAPNDSFLWLARFWLNNFVKGPRIEHLRDLRMSYEIGRNEGWINPKRNGLALAYYWVLPADLAELAVAEFVKLVRWGFVEEAAAIASGPGRQRRTILYPRLKDLNVDQRRPFARAMYGRDLDDVQVPGIAPPSPQIPMPVLPPGF